MNEQSDSANPTAGRLSRRAALGKALAAGAGLAGLYATAAVAAVENSPAPQPAEFVPENDYPYFGYEPKAESPSALQ